MEKDEEKPCNTSDYHGSSIVKELGNCAMNIDSVEKIDKLKKELAEAVKESTEYKEYKELYAYINRYPDIKRQVDTFRRENFYYQASDDVEDPLAVTKRLNEEYSDMRHQTAVNRFLIAEICLCRLVQDICLSVVDAVDFDVDFL